MNARIRGHAGVASVLVLVALATVGCARAAEPAASSRVGFCQGVNAGHPEGGTSLIEFKRGAELLGQLTLPNGGGGSIAVTPGDTTVYVDGAEAAQLMTTDGTTAYARVGDGCPPTLD